MNKLLILLNISHFTQLCEFGTPWYDPQEHVALNSPGQGQKGYQNGHVT